MKKSTKHMSKRQAEQRSRKMITSIHALIAVVAIIECVLLVVFSTYSWIETNSSLIIMNGPSSTVETVNKKLDIANQLNYMVDLDTDSSDWADLNSFFSHVKYFEFSKTTSPDGKTFYFPFRNNSNVNSNKFRLGDTTDYNTSYLYFDFVLRNNADDAENLDVFFEPDDYANIFTVTGDFTPNNGHTSEDYCNALKNAMRISITTQVGSAPASTGIYSVTGDANDSIPPGLSSPTDSNISTGLVHPNKISDHVYRIENNVIQSNKLFVAKKNADTKVSIRIWFELMDSDFQSVFGFNRDTHSFDSQPFSEIPNAQVGVKFAFRTSGNDLRALYFDDYTFSNADGGHLTDSNTNYSMWFVAYQPHVAASTDHPERTAGTYAIQMTADRTSSTRTRWYTTDTTISMMECLMNSGTYKNGHSNGANEYKYAYFCYGDFSTKTAVYSWPLPSAPASDTGDFTFNAYSYEPNSSVTTNEANYRKGTWKIGNGLWQDDDEYTIMTLLKLDDMTTGVTANAYNGGANEKFMTAAAITNNHANYLVYANNKNFTSFTASATTALTVATAPSTISTTLWGSTYTVGNPTTTIGRLPETNAAMYYDADEQVFKSYVPAFWLKGDAAGNNKGVSFTYTPSGVFNANSTLHKWYTDTPQPNDGEYIYTALGYTNAINNNCWTIDYGSGSGAYFTGVGTWGDVEKISFNTELIDADLSADYRYMIGITGYSSLSGVNYYVMIPDETNMIFSAYVPKNIGSDTAGEISFARYTYTTSTAQADHDPEVYWYANTRYTHTTYYPVNRTGTSSDSGDYSHGYWNLSVLVDGSYENLIYDTLTDGTGSDYLPDTSGDTIDYSPRANYGILQYSYDGQNWLNDNIICDDTSNTLNNSIDRYRFYAPAEGEDQTTVYWRWVPYAGYQLSETVSGETVTTTVEDTAFVYEHDTTTGIYIVVTEARNAISSSTALVPTGASAPSLSGSRLVAQALPSETATERFVESFGTESYDSIPTTDDSEYTAESSDAFDDEVYGDDTYE